MESNNAAAILDNLGNEDHQQVAEILAEILPSPNEPAAMKNNISIKRRTLRSHTHCARIGSHSLLMI